jgi:hypothetical protein
MNTIQQLLNLPPGKKHMHAAAIKNSKQLQAIYFKLLDGEWHTSLELADVSGTLCIGTRIQELKAPVNGYKIECVFSRTSENGARIHKYRLLQEEHNG